jgi:hypothetical protein
MDIPIDSSNLIKMQLEFAHFYPGSNFIYSVRLVGSTTIAYWGSVEVIIASVVARQVVAGLFGILIPEEVYMLSIRNILLFGLLFLAPVSLKQILTISFIHLLLGCVV